MCGVRTCYVHVCASCACVHVCNMCGFACACMCSVHVPVGVHECVLCACVCLCVYTCGMVWAECGCSEGRAVWDRGRDHLSPAGLPSHQVERSPGLGPRGAGSVPAPGAWQTAAPPWGLSSAARDSPRSQTTPVRSWRERRNFGFIPFPEHQLGAGNTGQCVCSWNGAHQCPALGRSPSYTCAMTKAIFIPTLGTHGGPRADCPSLARRLQSQRGRGPQGSLTCRPLPWLWSPQASAGLLWADHTADTASPV